MKVRIALLLDSYNVPSWQERVIAFILSHNELYIAEVMINSNHETTKSDKIVYRGFRKIERGLFGVSDDCFGRKDVEPLLKNIATTTVKPIRSKHIDKFPDEAASKLENLDLIIRFGFRILKGDILSVAKYGVWSLHHGDNEVNRGGPPAFWEVVNKEAVTGVTLLALSEVLDGGKVLGKAFVKTNTTSFNRNQNAVYWAGVELFCHTLNKLARTGQLPVEEEISVPAFYAHPLYRDPQDASAIQIGIGFFMDRATGFLTRLYSDEQWKILYRFNKSKLPDQSLYKYKTLDPPRGTDWADPFPVQKDGKFYVFIEELIKGKGRAHISCFQFDAIGKLLSPNPEVVLEEDHHLSYPFVFSASGNFYMIPESGAAGKVSLYESADFPRKWVLKKVLLEVELYDATVVEHDGRWYLFGTQRPFPGNSPHQYLYIYHTNDLLSGSWVPHPSNPVTRDVRGARPAGRIFRSHGRLIRPSQIGAPRYGYGIRFNEIITLTPDKFEERKIHEIHPNWDKNLLGAHTFNSIDGFTVLDGQFRV